MSTQMEVSIADVAFSRPLRDYLISRLTTLGGELWVTANVKIFGGVSDGDHLARLRIDTPGDVQPVPELYFLPPEFTTSLPVAGASSAEIRFKIDLVNRAAIDTIGLSVNPIPPPFFQPETIVRAPASEIEPSIHDSPATDLSSSLLHFELRFSAAADIERTAAALPTAPPYPPERNLDGGTANRPNCWQYNPVSSDSLVINRVEYDPPVPSFLNWKGWDIRENDATESRLFSSVYHQPKPAVGQPNCRPRSNVDAIVLHETGCSWNMDNPFWCAWNTQRTKANTAAHFVVRSDGAITQMYDVVQRVAHVDHQENDRSIGIEFTNQVWGHGSCGHGVPAGQYFTPARAADRSPRRIVRWLAREYAVPPLHQLEAMYRLVLGLINLLDVPRRWVSLDDHGEPHDPGDNRRLFLVDDWPASGYPNPTPAGIVSHFNMTGSHTDGAFQALYCWLRSEANLSRFPDSRAEDQAYRGAIYLIDKIIEHPCKDDPANPLPEWHRRRDFVDVTEFVRT